MLWYASDLEWIKEELDVGYKNRILGALLDVKKAYLLGNIFDVLLKTTSPWS